MKIISSYGVELRKQNIPIRQFWRFTVLLSAIWSKCMNLCGKNWPKLRKVRNVSMQRNIWCIQRNGIGPVDFDFCFPKMPSYFRRAAVQHALGECIFLSDASGTVESRGENRGKPYLKSEQYAMPVFTTMSCTVKAYRRRKMRAFKTVRWT